MKGLKMWVMTLIEYDAYGNGTIISSFAKPAKDSPIKVGQKKIFKAPPKKKKAEVENAW